MKLCYTLPEREAAALAELDAGTPIVCIPYDIEEKHLVDGYFAVTERGAYRLAKGEVLFTLEFPIHGAFTIEERRGLSVLMVTADKVEREVCRFTSRASSRFFAVLHTIESLAAGKHVHPDDNQDPEPICEKCGRPLMLHSTTCTFCVKKRDTYKSLLEATKGMRLILLFPLLVAAVTLAIRFIVPVLQKQVINNFLYPAEGVTRGTEVQFLTLLASLIVFELVSRVLDVVSARLSGIAGNRFDVRMRRKLFLKVEELSLATVNRRTPSYLATRINGDVVIVRNFLIQRLPMVFSQVLGLVVGLILIFSISPTMSLFMLIPVPLTIIAMALLRPRLVRLTQRSRTADIRHGRIQFDYLTGERVVKVFGREEDAIHTYSGYLTKRFREAWKYNEFSIVYSYILYFLFEIGSYLLLFFGNLWLFNGEIDAGTINQFTAYSAIFYGPLREFSGLPTEIATFVQALAHIKEIFDEEPEVCDDKNAQYPEIRGHIKMTRAYFGYNAYAPILRGVSLEIQPGEMIGIVGHSGCGKTTLVNLVMRLYDVQRGKVEIDGVDIRKIAQKHLRSHIGIVPQEVMLFDATVRENIRFSRPNATDEEVIAAAKAAGAHDFILSLPEGYNTRVGERGSSLSGGERQRIAIARALIHDPQILILDEATAALDAETERDIQQALERLSEGRTTIAIAHRLSTLRNADRIIVIDHGRVVEHGTHRELIEKRGRYYKLVMAQTSLAQAGIHAEV